MEAEALAREIEGLLKLRSIPFVMKMFAHRQEMEDIPRIRRPQSVHTLDQIVGQASRLGWTVGVTADDLVGAQCRAVVGLGAAKTEAWRSGEHMKGVWFETSEDAQAHQEAMNCVPDGLYEALAVGPLASGKLVDPEKPLPVIATTSKLMSTGVDAQTCKLIVLDQNIKSMTLFKQIIGRGTRLREDLGKSWFTILDFKRATELFADRDFDGDPVQMWILRPPGFDASKKTPLVFWVHGGPQGAWMDGWSTRWNPQAWAAQGWIVAMPNPRGSTGFGQKFTDQISHDWGGRVFTDLMACADWCAAQPWIDKDRMAAAGGSYGGYMMNWFQSHTDRFKTLVTHCGVYEFHSMYGTTDELWFDEWEHGIPWKNPDFAQHSPDRFAAKFRTPNLIIHNERDYRVPIGQGLALFTALQRQGVPSKLLYFPDEGHWVLKPQNSRLWHDTIFDWLRGYIGTAK
jgi:acetyl esterase/lipase